MAVWGSCGETLNHKVQRLQDRTLGILSTDRGNRNHDDCLRVQQLIDQEIAVTVFKSLNRNAPNYLTQMFVPLSEVHTHNARNHSTGLPISHKYVFSYQTASFFIHGGHFNWTFQSNDFWAVGKCSKFIFTVLCWH